MSIRLPVVWLLAATCASMAGSIRADAWARGRGAVYVHSGVAGMDATTAFDPSGQRIPFPGRGARQRRASMFFEVGVTDRLTVVATVPYQRLTARGLFNDFTTSGLADLDLRLRRSHVTSGGVFAIEVGAFVPLGYRRDDFPQLGNGRMEPVVNLGYGTSIPLLRDGFLSAQAGYRFRGGGLSDEIPYSLKVGTFLHPRIGTFLHARGWESRGDFRGIDPSFALSVADSESLQAGAEIYVRVTERIDVNGSWSQVIRGRNAAVGNEIAIGLAFHSR